MGVKLRLRSSSFTQHYRFNLGGTSSNQIINFLDSNRARADNIDNGFGFFTGSTSRTLDSENPENDNIIGYSNIEVY